MTGYTHLSAEQRELLERTPRNWSIDGVVPVAARRCPGVVNRPLLAALAEHGLLDQAVRAGRHRRWTLCLIREGLRRHCTEAETASPLQGLGALPDPARRSARVERVDPPDHGGEVRPGSRSPSRVPARTRHRRARPVSAERNRRRTDGFLLTGEKTYISNAPDADVYSVFARTTPDTGATRYHRVRGARRASEGLAGERLELLSPHPIGRLRFEDVFVPQSACSARSTAAGGWRCTP